VLHVCQAGFEAFLAKELNAPHSGKGSGWVRSPGRASCFSHYALENETDLSGAGAKPLAQALVDYFLQTSKGEVYDAPWPLVVEGSGEEGASKRANSVSELFLELAKKRVSRVAKLAEPGRPGPGPRRGLFAYLTGLDRAVVSRQALFHGQRRMADDPRAPSRSYLKVEEAYAVLGEAPAPGQSVADLGAAPGGWSYSAAKRGADVIAVDNGPLKGGAAEHPGIEHRAEDAFTFRPGEMDWLFCDMVENPDRVLELVSGWVGRGWCRRFVVNLKFGRLDPLPLLRRAESALAPRCRTYMARHLFHDREELTLVGRVS
jgi:23S rRNA (cytidine2498-2'-O)-methyltransferase